MEKPSNALADESQKKEAEFLKQAHTYLTDKYGDLPARAEGVLMRDIMTNHDRVNYVFEEDRGPVRFSVTRYEDEATLEDTLMGYMVRPQIEAELQTMALQTFPDAKCFVQCMSGPYPDQINVLSTFDEIKAQQEEIPAMYAEIYVPDQGEDQQEFEKKAEQLSKLWNETGLECALFIASLSEDQYQQLSDKTYQKLTEGDKNFIHKVKKAVE